ncbi:MULTISPECIES: DUF5367 domain-containing protein [Shouchella]|uniref:Uncharacterized protein n=2 Tax=Bacillaceae TaxID=186817 RepID=A0A060LXX4_9BACI|nr:MULTISPECIES: DUF5367 domain-containing protein [Bacillaceae]AIC93133.1 hypothetical protein BleG1_0525 [Shouchella lehensis G1]KQL58555.1 hypothetical protein AN965_03040 [Alkalicoccobacillus plakortidis]RQW22715.1 hypothetical protein EH196_02585 [Bacillus sp. C1-1]
MFFLFWGFLVWLGATAIFRFLGQFFFTPDNTFFLVAAYVIVVPLILVITLPLYRYKKLNAFNQLKAAVFIALPGMVFDVIVLIYFAEFFVNLDPGMDQFFASWLLLAYSVILLTGLISNGKQRS